MANVVSVSRAAAGNIAAVKSRSTGDGGLVYSTEGGRMCPACRRPMTDCRCADAAPRPTGDGVARVRRETQRRGGKVVTVVRGLALDDAALAALGKQLRSACGAGGTVKGGVIEIQGDQIERVATALRDRGFTVKLGAG